MTTDIKLKHDAGYWDISFSDLGDIDTEGNFDTAILLSIFGEARASADEIPESNRRRGWVGNETTPSFEQGSKVWEFEQERITGSMLAELGVVVRNALQWFIDDGYVDDVVVQSPRLVKGVVSVGISYIRDGSIVESRLYELWEATGSF